MDRSCHIHGISSTHGSTTNNEDDMENDAPFYLQFTEENLVILLNFIIYFSFCDITFFPFKPKGQDCFSF